MGIALEALEVCHAVVITPRLPKLRDSGRFTVDIDLMP